MKEALQHIKKGKAAGPDNITLEELEAMGDCGNEILTFLLNEIYNSGYIPENLLQSIFIALPKKPRSIDCEDYRTVSLISHITGP